MTTLVTIKIKSSIILHGDLNCVWDLGLNNPQGKKTGGIKNSLIPLSSAKPPSPWPAGGSFPYRSSIKIELPWVRIINFLLPNFPQCAILQYLSLLSFQKQSNLLFV